MTLLPEKTRRRQMKNKNKGTFSTALLNTPYVVWASLFIVVPLIFVLYYSFFNKNTGEFSLEYIKYFFTEEYVIESFGRSVVYSIAATALCLVIAYPFAYFLSKKKPASQKIQMILIMAPMWMNMVVRTKFWSNILEYNGILNTLLESVGFSKQTFLGTAGAVIFGMVYNYLPYMILPIYTSMSKIGDHLLEAAEDLGCNGRQKLTRVIMPLSLSGVVSGIIMVFVPSISTFYISQAMSFGTKLMIGDVIDVFMKNSSDGTNTGSAMSLVLMIIILICTFVMNKYADDRDGGVII